MLKRINLSQGIARIYKKQLPFLMEYYTISLKILLFLVLNNFTTLTKAQKIFTEFTESVFLETFNESKDIWPQKYTPSELMVIQDGQYIIRRIEQDLFSIVLPKSETNYSNMQIFAQIKVVAAKDHSKGAGVVFLATPMGSGALIIEVNNNREYRIKKYENGYVRTLSGQADGWVKNSDLNKKGFNKIAIKGYDKIYDIYFNGKYAKTWYEPSFKAGKIGFYVSGGSEIAVNRLEIKLEEKQDLDNPSNSLNDNPLPEVSEKTNEPNNELSTSNQSTSSSSSSYKELILVFKKKFEDQRLQISELESQLMDAQNNTQANNEILEENNELKERLNLKENEISVLKKQIDELKRNVNYLESVKSLLKENPDSDILLHLTNILDSEQQKVQSLNKELEQSKNENILMEQQIKLLKRQIENYKEQQ